LYHLLLKCQNKLRQFDDADRLAADRLAVVRLWPALIQAPADLVYCLAS
jgi:hypothetical protein